MPSTISHENPELQWITDWKYKDDAGRWATLDSSDYTLLNTIKRTTRSTVSIRNGSDAPITCTVSPFANVSSISPREPTSIAAGGQQSWTLSFSDEGSYGPSVTISSKAASGDIPEVTIQYSWT